MNNPIPPKTIHLLSGGLDSTVLLYALKDKGHTLHALFFDYGQPQLAQERLQSEHHAAALKVKRSVITTQIRARPGTPIVPNRNACFLSLAANLAISANADLISIGCCREDAATFADCREEFIANFNAMLRANHESVTVIAPLINTSKEEIYSTARALGIADATWSCYRGGAQPCGECLACTTHEAARRAND